MVVNYVNVYDLLLNILFYNKSSTRVKKVDDSLVADLREMIDQHNPHAKAFRMARDRMQYGDSTEMRLQLISKRNCDGRRYNLPTTSEVAALIVVILVQISPLGTSYFTLSLVSYNEFTNCILLILLFNILFYFPMAKMDTDLTLV